MSWIIESILLKRDSIRSRVEGGSNFVEYESEEIPTVVDVPIEELIYNSNYSSTDSLLEDNLYNDLLMIESKIEELAEKGILDGKEIEVLRMASGGMSMEEIASNIGVARVTASKYFKESCSKIGYYLGGYFTNEGFIEYMRENYSLGEEEVETMVEYMESIYRHRTVDFQTKKGENK